MASPNPESPNNTPSINSSGGWSRDRFARSDSGLQTRTRQVGGSRAAIGTRQAVNEDGNNINNGDSSSTSTHETSQSTGTRSPGFTISKRESPRREIISGNEASSASRPESLSQIKFDQKEQKSPLQSSDSPILSPREAPFSGVARTQENEKKKLEKKESFSLGKVFEKKKEKLKKNLTPSLLSTKPKKKENTDTFDEATVIANQEYIKTTIKELKKKLDYHSTGTATFLNTRNSKNKDTNENAVTISTNKPTCQTPELDEKRHHIVKEIYHSELSYIKQIESAVKFI